MANLDRDLFDESEFDSDEDAIREGEADAGRVVSNAEFSRWLVSWGSPGEAPPPAEWFK